MYNKLFESGKIGDLEIKNRTVMPAMGTSLAQSDGSASDEIIAFYEERAKGGVGLIITEITRVNDLTGVGTPNQLCVTKPYQIQRLERLARSVHRHGTKIFLQLHHPGRQSHSRLIDGRQIVGASSIPCKTIGEEPRALTTEEVEDMVKDFIKGAKIAQMGGVDGVELHAAHGYLLCQFLSEATNNRTDKYGGNFENRHRMLTEIIMGIKYICGPHFPISVRIDGDEFVEGGISLDQAIKTAIYLESIGVDCINVSAGSYESANTIIEPYSYQTGWRKHLAREIKKNISIPVIAVNTVKKPEDAERFLEEEVCDFVGLGRALLADPDFVNKAREDETKDIRPCIGCLHCIESLMNGHTLRCAVNPKLGYEKDYRDLEKVSSGQKVLVVGGGPAGLQASIILAQRGFETILVEAKPYLGGSVTIGSKPPHKDLLSTLVENLEYQARQEGVDIRLNTKADMDLIDQINPYAVYLALGGKNISLSLSEDRDKIMDAIEVLEEEKQIKDKKIFVIGSGMTGLETAEYLAEQGNQVTVVEMAKEIGSGIHKALLFDITARLKAMGVEFISYHQLKDFKDGKIILLDRFSNELSLEEADYCVLSIGVRDQRSDKLVEEVKRKYENTFNIGDSDRPGRIYEAMVAGLDSTYNLRG